MSDIARIAELEREVQTLKRRLAKVEQRAQLRADPLHNFGLPTPYYFDGRSLRERLKVSNG